MTQKLKDSIIPLAVLIPMIAWGIWYYWPQTEKKVELIETHLLEKQLKILIWQNYIPENEATDLNGKEYYLYNDFSKEYGIGVTIDYFDTNEELHMRLKEGGTDYDIVMPSNFLVPTLVKDGLIEKINKDNISKFKGIDTQILDNYEMQELLEYSVPYIFGVTGLAYDSWKSTEIPLHWGFIFEPGKDLPEAVANNIRYTYKNRISVIDDMRTTLGMALIYLGYKPDSPNINEVNEAGDLVINAIQNLHMQFESTHVADKLVSGDFYMSMAWSGDAMVAMEDSLQRRRTQERERIAKFKNGATELEASVRDELPKVRFTSPHPQALAFIDCFSIVKGSKNVDNAEKFLNYLLDPVIAADVTNFSYYGNTVASSKEFIDRDLLNGPPYFLPGDNSVAFIKAISEEGHDLYRTVWERVKTAYNEVHAIHTVEK